VLVDEAADKLATAILSTDVEANDEAMTTENVRRIYYESPIMQIWKRMWPRSGAVNARSKARLEYDRLELQR